MAGISRSVTLTIAYLIRRYGLAMQSAYQYVKERRPAISPNLNFMGQLVEFESCIMGEGGGGEGGGGEGCEQQLHLEDYAPSLEQEEMSEMMKVCIYYISIYLLYICGMCSSCKTTHNLHALP